MIFYFSATGNSRYTAEYIAREIGTEVVNIARSIDQHNYTFDAQSEPVGIVSPVYCQGMPSIVRKFIRRVKINNCGYFFYIATFGMFSGNPKAMFEAVRRPRLKVDAYYTVRMPDNFTPIYDLSDKKKVEKRNQLAQEELVTVARRIRERRCGDFCERKIPAFAAKVMYRIYPMAAKTSHLTVDTEVCIGCGLCQAKCPAHAIEMKKGHPIWVKDQCIMCLGCLHRCPEFAIQYGKSTKNHGQYHNPNTTL